jgi:hypothetical protein
MRTNPKHDSTCWCRFGMYGKEKCYGCTFESECELLPEDNPSIPLRKTRPEKYKRGNCITDRIDNALAEIKKTQKTFTPSAISMRANLTRGTVGNYLGQREDVRRIKSASGYQCSESVWEFV